MAVPIPSVIRVSIQADFPSVLVPANGSAYSMTLGDGRPIISSYGGWTSVARPRRVAITDYQGSSPLQMDLPLMLDGWLCDGGPQSIEAECLALERMALVQPGSLTPSVVQLYGGGIPHTELKWVINDITWADAIMNNNGQRVRQAFSLTLLQFIDDTFLVRVTPGHYPNEHGTAVRRHLVVKGDTLTSIAAKFLGKAKRWPEITKLNPGMRSSVHLRVGAYIKIPAK